MTSPYGSPDPDRPSLAGILGVCALVFGAGLLFVAHKAGDAGSTTLFTVIGLGALALAVVLAVVAGVEHRSRS